MIGEAMRSRHGETHSITEKRRRYYKIKERLETLQQLVPGCDKQLSHASTLDQTIRYVKSLQRQVQAMSVGPATAAVAAVYPVVSPATAAPVAISPMVLGPAPAMVEPWGRCSLLPLYPVASMVPASPAAAAPRAVVEPAAGRHRRQGSRRGKGTDSSLRQRECTSSPASQVPSCSSSPA